jgi:hypothetical protein
MLQLMGASLALAGLTTVPARADEWAILYVNAPEFVVPDNPRWYATAVTLGGIAQPVLGKTHAGRPIKLEGNPDHPATEGASDVFLQAALLGLYDPERLQAPRHLGAHIVLERLRRHDGVQDGRARPTAGQRLSPSDQRNIVAHAAPPDWRTAATLAAGAMACARAGERRPPAPGSPRGVWQAAAAAHDARPGGSRGQPLMTTSWARDRARPCTHAAGPGAAMLSAKATARARCWSQNRHLR